MEPHGHPLLRGSHPRSIHLSVDTDAAARAVAPLASAQNINTPILDRLFFSLRIIHGLQIA